MDNDERIKIGLASILYLIMDSYNPGENDNIDKLLISICDFLHDEYEMTKDEIRELVNSVTVQIIEKARDKLLN